ncbi:MAG: isoprenylcysteine carboxylmethyltransferase family protein [Tepidisphaeraceae bacterium]|jgi:protein-S-isoprenylcysteine O-methyltransferase Ste14
MLYHLPTLVISVIVLFYWGRVLRMAQKSRRVCGHSANLIPREPMGKLTRIIWFPVTALWIALPPITVIGHMRQTWLQPLFFSAPVAWIAVAAAIAALLGSLVCWKIMGRSWRMGIDPDEVTPLVTSGPYAVVRHPIYALSSLLVLCSAASCASPLMLCVATLHILLLLFESRREEIYLIRRHGPAYVEYRRHTGRFVPRLAAPQTVAESP